MKIHFIAIGGSAMHNLAIALHRKGFEVSGSDDEVFEPSKSRLQKCGLLPAETGWFTERISTGLDAVILGMHAREDNPELLKAQELGLKVYSYPEYLYEHSKNKTRVVIGGSHGKTTITAMILHVLQRQNMEFDFMVGAQLEGFDAMVQLTEAPIIILEGDEYLSSPIDRRPKFHHYKANIALLSGIAWDHINVFPVYEDYVEQFRIFVRQIPDDGCLVYCISDKEVKKVVEEAGTNCLKIPYGTHEYSIEEGLTYLLAESDKIPLEVFGEHNLQNINGARLVCGQLGVSDPDFYAAISTFKGASNRLELVGNNERTAVYKDFAHSPSKLQATVKAAKEQFPDRELVACMELHTFSSLSEGFLNEYEGTMKSADSAIVYYNPHTIAHKKLPAISMEQVKQAFGKDDLAVYNDSGKLLEDLLKMDWNNCNLLLMTSGNFDGVDVGELAGSVTGLSSG